MLCFLSQEMEAAIKLQPCLKRILACKCSNIPIFATKVPDTMASEFSVEVSPISRRGQGAAKGPDIPHYRKLFV